VGRCSGSGATEVFPGASINAGCKGVFPALGGLLPWPGGISRYHPLPRSYPNRAQSGKVARFACVVCKDSGREFWYLQVTKTRAAGVVFPSGCSGVSHGDPRGREVGLMLPEGCCFVLWRRYVWGPQGSLEGFCLCFSGARRFCESPGRDRSAYVTQDPISPPGGCLAMHRGEIF